MKLIESLEDLKSGLVTYELPGGRYLRCDAAAVRKYGLEKILRAEEVDLPTERIPVLQFGRQVGDVPALFDPYTAKITSPFYDVRKGDFTRTDHGWVAADSLGHDDLSAVDGFVFGRD